MKNNFTIIITILVLIASMWHGIFERNVWTLGIGVFSLMIIWLYFSLQPFNKK